MTFVGEVIPKGTRKGNALSEKVGPFPHQPKMCLLTRNSNDSAVRSYLQAHENGRTVPENIPALAAIIGTVYVASEDFHPSLSRLLAPTNCICDALHWAHVSARSRASYN